MSQRWANKMRVLYTTGFLVLIALALLPGVYTWLTTPPTCSDGIQNQGETAVDLGGPCLYLNPAELKQLTVRWSRSFMVVPGLYSSVAYIENPNPSAGIRHAHYVVRLYDEKNVLVAERVGETFIPAGKIVPIFEGNMQVGGRVPVRTTCTLFDPLTWERMEDERAAEIAVSGVALKEANGLPRLSAAIENSGVYALANLVVVAALFDEAGNVLGASRTVIPQLDPDSSKEIVFTWPKQFTSFVARMDVVPLIPPVYLRGL